MSNIILIIITAVLVLHGLIHLIGTAVYMKLAPVEGFVYKGDPQWKNDPAVSLAF